jgi:hypothetical protein
VLPSQAPELLRPRTAHRHAHAVEQLRLEIPAGVGPERPHLFEIHDVTVPVEAKKFYLDGKGAETEAPLAERIEIGLFTAEPGRDAFDESNVILLERWPIRSGRELLKFVSDTKPTYAGVDPYNFYIDRNAADNVLPVS